MNKKSDHTIIYQYTFLLDSGIEKAFDLHLDHKTLGMVPIERKSYPHWTRLACCKCPNCPLNEEEHPNCPIAVNILDLMDFFNDVASFEEVDVRITTDERSYMKRTTMSEAISSLLGIYMVTSGCPVMDKLRPMVRFHLPLATAAETTFRALAMYLIPLLKTGPGLISSTQSTLGRHSGNETVWK